MATLNAWRKAHQTSATGSKMPDVHASFMRVNQGLFTTMEKAGATGVSLWALYNTAFLSKAGPDSYDMAQLKAKNAATFAGDFKSYGYTWELISALLGSVASASDILNEAATYMRGNIRG